MSKQYWSTKQLRIELKPSKLTVMLLVIIHLLCLLALACAKLPVPAVILLLVSITFSVYWSLYRYGFLLSSYSIETLEFKQRRWQFKLRGDSVYQGAEVAGRLAFGIVMLEVRGCASGSVSSGFVLLTEGQLSPEQFRILKGLVLSA